METNESRQDPVEMLLKYLESGKNGENLDDKCTCKNNRFNIWRLTSIKWKIFR